MNQPKRSIADGLVDGRYRLDRLVYKTKSAGFHEATHRNGSTAWLKIPLSPANGPGITLEASLVNSMPSALALRDDGTDERGLPYLVVDPIVGGELLENVTERARKGKRDNAERVLAVGNALITAVSAIASAGYAVTSLELDEVVVLPAGDVALLGLDRIVKLDDTTKAESVAAVSRVLRMVVVECMDVSAGTQGAKVFDAANAKHADIGALHAAWRATATAPLPEVKRRAPSMADVPPSSPSSSAPLTPLAMEISDVELLDSAPANGNGTDDGSILAYLKSGQSPPSIPAPATKGGEMYDPLAKVPELPRVVQATMTANHEVVTAASPVKRWLAVGAGVTVAAAAFAIGIGIALGDGAPDTPNGSAKASAMATASPPAETAAPPTHASSPSEPSPAALAPGETKTPSPPTLELDAPPAPATPPGATPTPTVQTTGKLRTDNAPPGRKIFIDGELVGEAPLSIDLPCGPHTIRAGNKVEARPFQIACGGERVVRFSATGNWTVK